MKAILKILSLPRFLLLVFIFEGFFATSQAQQRAWKEFGKLHYARHYFGGLIFAPRQILVMGGYTNSNGALTSEITTACELIDIGQRTITDAAPMNIARAESVFLLTADSNIVAISGFSKNNQTTPTCELYSRTTKNWTVLGSLNIGRRQHIACFISRDEVLVVGGRDNTVGTIARAEIFNIRTGRSRFVQDFPSPINLGVADVSSRSKPLFFGGRTGGANSFRTSDVYEYDVVNNRWLVVTQILDGVHGPNLLKLWNGRLFFAGGSKQETPTTFSTNAAIENYPKFNQVASIQARHWHTIAQWNTDTIAVIGGMNENRSIFRSVEWVDIKQQRSFSAPTLLEPHEYSISISVPEFDASGRQTRATLVAISGLSGAIGTNTPTVEILEETIKQIIPFPSITSALTETDDCTVFRLRLQASLGAIRAIELGTSANVTLQTLTLLPAGNVEVLVRLINPFAPPSLTSLRITNDALQTEIVPVSVVFPQRRSTTLSVIGATEHLFGDSVVTFTCVTLRLRNNASAAVVFPAAYLGRNIEFSAPPAQFPLRIPAGSESAIRLCYAPLAIGLQRDTLTLTENCAVLRVPLAARGTGEMFIGTSRCAAPLSLHTIRASSGETVIVADAPFPQPSDGVVHIPVYLATEAPSPAEAPTATLYNGLGTIVGKYSIAEWSVLEKADISSAKILYSGAVHCSTECLPAGCYRMILRGSDGAMASVALVVAH